MNFNRIQQNSWKSTGDDDGFISDEIINAKKVGTIYVDSNPRKDGPRYLHSYGMYVTEVWLKNVNPGIALNGFQFTFFGGYNGVSREEVKPSVIPILTMRDKYSSFSKWKWSFTQKPDEKSKITIRAQDPLEYANIDPIITTKKDLLLFSFVSSHSHVGNNSYKLSKMIWPDCEVDRNIGECGVIVGDMGDGLIFNENIA